ncbi:MAG: isocitrate/isopropylmalate family dehydrogenase, partial [Micavibrio sp.]
GQDKANPLAAILSFSMALRYSLDEGQAADMIDEAVQAVLESGIRTADIMEDGCTLAGCAAMGGALLKELDKRLAQAA